MKKISAHIRMLFISFCFFGIASLRVYAENPIVFIHGWNGKTDTWANFIKYMTTADTDGFVYTSNDKILAVDYSKITGVISETFIEEIATEVWNQIDKGFPDGSKPPKMDFVVHSMGGLVLRMMVAAGKLPESRIGKVVTLGTPHYGQRHNVPDWLLGGSKQTKQMLYGSEFIWDLAHVAKKISANKVLCIGGTGDNVVDEWSAALVDNECRGTRYVARCHSTAPINNENAIYYCKEQWSDPVYKLVKEFFLHDRLFGGSLNGEKNEGAILFQIVDGKGKPVSYDTDTIAPVVADEEGNEIRESVSYYGSNAKGIGAIANEYDVLLDGKVPTGRYTLNVVSSKDNIFAAFTTDPIEVKRGRTTVIQIPAENVRPLDYVFLIDTTGSMGSHISSVKSNAKNLIQTKLLNGARDCRVAVVDYRDFPERTGDYEDYPYNVKCQFTSDAATAIGAINSLTLGYGGDGPETVYSGIAACIREEIGKWRPNAVKTIMIMCDAAPLDPEPYTGFTKDHVAKWSNTMKIDEEDDESGIDWTRYKSKAVAMRKLAAKVGESGVVGTGISIYPVLTSSSSSLRAAFADIAEETGGKIVSASAYASVADAVEEVIEQSVAANGFETEIITARETDGSVAIRVYGGNTAEEASIGYQIVSGSAVNGKDFSASEGVQRLTWNEGERSYKTITIPVMEDESTSNDKFFSIILCDPVGMGLGGINVCRINLLDRDSDGEYRIGDVYVQGLSRQSDVGSVKGSGFCAAGSAVTLSATAKSGYVFTSWENGSTASRRRITAQTASSNAVDGVATYVASFIPLADLPVPTIEPSGVVTGIVGQAISWNLNYYSMSEATVKCAGLPSGLSFADGAISGTPDKRGINTVTFTVRNAKGVSSTAVSFVFVRDPFAPYISISGEEGEFDASSASTYNGYVVGTDGATIGTLLVKAAKANVRTGMSKITATLQLSNGKKISFRGVTDNGQVSMTAAGQVLAITLGKDGMTGSYGGYDIDGARNFFTSKDKSEVGAANDILSDWLGAVVAIWDGGTASVAIGKKGKAKATVTLVDGTKATANAQLLVGEEWLCVPAVVTRRMNLVFTFWLPRDGGKAVVEGLSDDVVVGRPGALKAGAKFRIDAEEFSARWGQRALPYLPDGVSVVQNGTRWTVADGAKAGKVVYKRGTTEIDESKLGGNPSALKLTYRAKDGSFKGSFKVYVNNGGRLKSTAVNVSGVVVDGVGYGMATIKKVGSVPVTIE